MLKNFLKGLLFGSALGAVGGLLSAPRSGNDTRRKLTRELNEAAETTLDLNQSLQRFQQAVITTKQTAEELIPNLQKGLESDITAYKFQAEPRIKQIQDQVAVLNQHVTQLDLVPTEEKNDK